MNVKATPTIMKPISPELKQIIIDRALGKPLTIDPFLEDLLDLTMNDKNSSMLRELITVAVAGYEPIPGKLGYDAVCPVTGDLKEVKPSSNGNAGISDYTTTRFIKDRETKVHIVQSLFLDGRLYFVVEYSIEAIAERLQSQIQIQCVERKNQYVRSASWSYLYWINHPSLRLHYIDWTLIDSNPKCMTKPMLTQFRQKFALIPA